jgi:hypothetical protein
MDKDRTIQTSMEQTGTRGNEEEKENGAKDHTHGVKR